MANIPDNRKRLGNAGETLAGGHLVALGYEIVATNVRPMPGLSRGEIDIVAYDGETLCFVEVKTRRSLTADAAESVNDAKRRKLVTLAEAYLSVNEVPDTVPCRFDVVAICLSSKLREPRVELFRDAFTPGE